MTQSGPTHARYLPNPYDDNQSDDGHEWIQGQTLRVIKPTVRIRGTVPYEDTCLQYRLPPDQTARLPLPRGGICMQLPQLAKRPRQGTVHIRTTMNVRKYLTLVSAAYSTYSNPLRYLPMYLS